MKINTDVVWNVIKDAVWNSGSVRDKLHRVIDACEASFQHPDWQRLREIDYEAAVLDLEHWFPNVVAANPPPIRIRGLWVGLCNPVQGREATADMYFAGAETFDRNDPDWAAEASYYPADAYANSVALRSIYQVAYSGHSDLGNDAEWPLCLAFAACTVRELLGVARPSMFHAVGSVGVSVGFDSGDYLDLGQLTAEGLVPFNRV